MYTYTISFRYSRNGRSWSSGSTTVKADSDMGAIAQVDSKYPYVQILGYSIDVNMKKLKIQTIPSALYFDTMLPQFHRTPSSH